MDYSDISRIGEKFLEWVDEPLPPEFILESVTLYWLTETYARSIYTYREVCSLIAGGKKNVTNETL